MKEKSSLQAIVIFSGFNERAVIAFLRTISKVKIAFGIIALSESDPIFNSVYKKNVLSVRERTSLETETIQNSLKEASRKLGGARLMIAPSSEALNRFFLENPEILKSTNGYIPLVDKQKYEKISDKLSFVRLCQEFEIDTPKEYITSEAKAPCVAKPSQYFGTKKETRAPIIISTQKELEQFNKEEFANDFFMQDYVEGSCIYLLFYFSQDGSFSVTAQENLLQQENGKSMLVAKSIEPDTIFSLSKYVSLFSNICYRGLVMVEIKKNKGKEFMIEANPRFWGPSQLFVDSGVNLFLDLLYDYGLLEQQAQHSFRQAYYFWNDGIAENYSERPNVALYNYSLKQFSADLGFLKNIEIYSRSDTAL